MGLDVYFFNRTKEQTKETITDADAYDALVEASQNCDIMELLKQLKDYSDKSNNSFRDCLFNAINDYLTCKAPSNSCNPEEVAYFRKFWWVIDFFGYSDEDYGKDKPVTKEQLEKAKDFAEKAIKMVIKHFTDKGFEIEHSPFDYVGKTARWGGDAYYLTFKNGVLSDEIEEEADAICSDVFDCEASFIFTKVCELYVQFSEILRDTDFTKEVIVMNADW